MHINAASANTMLDLAGALKRADSQPHQAGRTRPDPGKLAGAAIDEAHCTAASKERCGTHVGYSYTSNDLQHLMIDWGMTDSPYDINGDGIVNVSDMTEMLASLNGPGQPWSPQSQVNPEKLPMNQHTLNHLMVDWGMANSPYDFNGDGTVNVTDMLHVISNWGQPAAETSPAALTDSGIAADTGNAADVAAGDSSNASLTAAVTADDTSTRHAPAAAEVVQAAAPVRPDSSIAGTAPGKLRKLTAALIERLSAAGYAHKPPQNIREIVSKLDIEPADRRQVLTYLHHYYAQGLGVNVQG